MCLRINKRGQIARNCKCAKGKIWTWNKPNLEKLFSYINDACPRTYCCRFLRFDWMIKVKTSTCPNSQNWFPKFLYVNTKKRNNPTFLEHLGELFSRKRIFSVLNINTVPMALSLSRWNCKPWWVDWCRFSM